MDTQPVQNIVATPPSAAAAGSAATGDGAAPEAATQQPHRFRALLALQLGSGTPTGAKPAHHAAIGDDDKTAADTPAAATDALSALNLPALLPASAIATPQPMHGGHRDSAESLHSHESPSSRHGVSALQDQAEPAGAKPDARSPLAHSGEASLAAEPKSRLSTAQDGEAAALHSAGAHAAENAAQITATSSPGAPPPMAVPVSVVPTAPAAAAAAPAQAALDARVGTQAWNSELGQKIVWMVGEKLQSAELSVNPPDLGPLDIKLTIDGAQTTAVFTSPHSAVREAVETALPRLREVLADSGIMLGNASVTADTPRDGRAYADQRPGVRSTDRLVTDDLAAPVLTRTPPSTRGLVDLFA